MGERTFGASEANHRGPRRGVTRGHTFLMKLRELSLRGVSAWPPQWASSYGPGDRFAIGEEGVLTGIRVNEKDGHLVLTIKWEAREHVGVLRWDGPPGLKTVENFLKAKVGNSIREIGNLDLH